MRIDIKLSDNTAGVILFVFVVLWLSAMALLYDGSPDLYDVLINKISNGQVAIPEPPKSIWE